ncbi:ATP-binding protein [TM7 phylum sp. oral taxon 346]|nr:ATP-binding protein [TM7 phylum sp. oral taxon 346]
MNPSSISHPHAIMMVGLPGSGKTFFAQQFSEMFNAPFVDSQFISEHSLDSNASEEVCQRFLAEIARTKQTFIYEDSNLSRARRAEFARWAKGHGYKPLIIWVQTDEATCRRRIQKGHSLGTINFDAAVKSFTEPNAIEKPVVISGKHTYKTQARTVLARLGDSNRPSRPMTSLARQRPEVRRRGISIQ